MLLCLGFGYLGATKRQVVVSGRPSEQAAKQAVRGQGTAEEPMGQPGHVPVMLTVAKAAIV